MYQEYERKEGSSVELFFSDPFWHSVIRLIDLKMFLNLPLKNRFKNFVDYYLEFLFFSTGWMNARFQQERKVEPDRR